MTSPIEVYPGVAFTHVGDVGLILWTGEPSILANRWLIQRFNAALGSRKGTALGLQIIGETAGTPDTETRRYVQEAFRNELSRLRRFINAPIGDSFKQSVVRTILRGMALIGDKTKALVIASTIDEALDLVVANASAETPSRAVLSEHIDALFAAQKVVRPASSRVSRLSS